MIGRDKLYLLGREGRGSLQLVQRTKDTNETGLMKEQGSWLSAWEGHGDGLRAVRV